MSCIERKQEAALEKLVQRLCQVSLHLAQSLVQLSSALEMALLVQHLVHSALVQSKMCALWLHLHCAFSLHYSSAALCSKSESTAYD